MRPPEACRGSSERWSARQSSRKGLCVVVVGCWPMKLLARRMIINRWISRPESYVSVCYCCCCCCCCWCARCCGCGARMREQPRMGVNEQIAGFKKSANCLLARSLAIAPIESRLQQAHGWRRRRFSSNEEIWPATFWYAAADTLALALDGCVGGAQLALALAAQQVGANSSHRAAILLLSNWRRQRGGFWWALWNAQQQVH